VFYAVPPGAKIMANPEHVEILKQGAKVWQKWRGAHVSVVPDFNKADLNRADLNGANLNGADLNGANLNKANLIRATLNRADLTGANLNWAGLMEANLDGADLNRADLNRADLNRAGLYRANLTGANLNGARLTLTIFSSTVVAQADFTGARMERAVFADMDLSEAIGLETVRHTGPSTIGVDTILKSKGEIPEIFLRGAGMPDDVIEFVRTLQGKPIQFYSGFISYNHEDKVFARRLHDVLQGRGIRCWRDEHEMRPGDPLHESVNQAIRMRDKLILCCSRTSLNSWWVDIEVKAAFEEERRRSKEQGKRVRVLIPLDLDGYIFSEDCTYELSGAIKTRLVGDFVGWEHDNSKFEAQFEQVVKAMQTGRASL
jgi:TIR domain-containing protein/pentapeptide repeat protein